MGAKSKAKGNRYERRVAKLLTEYTSVNFRRIPSSGAFNKFKGVTVAEHVFSGDIVCDRTDFRFSVEAKSQKVFSFQAILKDPDNCAFTKWWKQCVEDAQAVSKVPMLLFKPDTQEDFIATTGNAIALLKISTIVHFSLNVYSQLPTPKIIRWKTFVEKVNPDRLFGD